MVKNKFPVQRSIIAIVFVLSSIVLFVNNLTEFFVNLNLLVKIEYIYWSGIILSVIWWMFLFGRKEKMW